MALIVGKNMIMHDQEPKEHPYQWNMEFPNASPNIIVVLGPIRMNTCICRFYSEFTRRS